LILGLSYKPEVDIVTESPALDLFELFSAEGADVRYSDPFVPVAPRSSPRRSPSLRAERTRTEVRGSGLSIDVDPDVDPDVAPDVYRSALASIALSRESIAVFDAVVVVTDHAAFDWDLVAKHARLVIDTRNALASRMTGRSNYVKA
jgi:UDP-N-acetyl-D-glucosamine dehydrogenase